MPTAIITGASRGLGLALARTLAVRGWGRELGAVTNVVAIPGDVADEGHRGALVQAAGDPIDLLVNNASLLGPSPQPVLSRYPLDELERVYRVNGHGLKPIHDWVSNYERMWTERFEALDSVLDELKESDDGD